MAEHRNVTWPEVQSAAACCADRWDRTGIAAVHGVPRGGLVPAAIVAERLGVPVVERIVNRDVTLVVDDLVDSGATATRYADGPFDALFRKSHSPQPPRAMSTAVTLDGWLVFPWERTSDEHAGPTDAVRRLLQHIGEDPERDGLLDTPKRVVKALGEMTAGYALDPADVLGTTFDVGSDELVLVTGVQFTSLCEHHLLPFVGTASVGYLPGQRVVGLSKLARLVDLYAHRLQVQERLTSQIAEAIMAHLDAQAAGVIIRAHHSCMSCRGVRKHSDMVTSSMLGKLRDEPSLRAEFLSLAVP